MQKLEKQFHIHCVEGHDMVEFTGNIISDVMEDLNEKTCFK